MVYRFRYAALLLLTCLLGLGVRFAAPGLPHTVSKYGGSALWAAAIFWLVSLAASRSTVVVHAEVSLLLACAIEFFKLVRTPPLDHFRLTLPGKLLLGRFFSFRDIAAYAFGIAMGALLDTWLTRSRNPSR